MAEEIVSCPGCAKKFRIPEGAPCGTFQCTACDAAVPYGKAAAQPARGAAPAGRAGARSAPAAKGAAPVARAAKPEPRGGGRSAARGRSRGRRDEADDEPEERGHRARKKTNPAVLFGSIGGILLVGVVVAIAASRNNSETLPAAVPPQTSPTTQPAAAGATPAAVPSATPAAGAPAAEPGASDKPGESSGIGGAQQSPGKGSYGAYFHQPGDQLFVRHPDLPGTTETERAALDKDAASFADRNSGKAGTDARTRLRKAGKKSIPSLVSVFEQHWKGTKWTSDDERFASYQIQKLLAEIVKADRPGGDFFATFGPGVSVPAADFERAAKMWTAWWLGQGQAIEKFKDFPE